MSGRAIQWRARWTLAVLTFAAGACCCSSWPTDAPAEGATAVGRKTPESAALRIVAVHAGFAGQFKVGCWTPFEIELEGGSQAVSGRVEIVAPDGDGVPSRVHVPRAGDLAVGPGERKTVSMYAKIGRLASEVTVDFRTEAGIVASRRLNTQTDGPLAGVLPSSETLVVSVGAPDAADDESPRALRGVKVARLSDIRQLPGDWWGYEGVTALILSTGDDAISSQLATPSPRLAALDLWVRMGGKLVLSVGRSAEKVLAAGSGIQELAPGRLESIVPLRQSTALETYADTNESLSAAGPFALEVPKLRDVGGKIEAFAGTNPRDLPLVVRAGRGFGEVVFVAFDLERPPFANWAARPQLLEKLLGGSVAVTDDKSAGTLGAVTTLGFVDLAGQLRGALDQFAGVRLVPFWFVALLVTAYIVCIGPLDYFLVKRVFRRMEATWLSFAVTVVVFSAGAFALAYGLKGRQLRVNQVDVVDFDAETGLVRGTSWSYVYSPSNATYNLSLAPDRAAGGRRGGGILFSWFGLPGGGFGGMDVKSRGVGGMDTASPSLPLFTEAYDFAGRLDAIERVPIAVWSSKAFVARWWRDGDGGVEAHLAYHDKLAGTLTSHLEMPLTDAVLMYGKWAYVIRELAPGRQIDFETMDPQTTDTYLRHVTAQGERQVAPPYDRASFDIPRIVEITTAHDLAGGEKYTGLVNHYQGFSETSALVQNGRAVLFGRSGRPAARLERDGEPLAGADTETWTFYRFVFPVREQPVE
ncbi:MAG: hypothetical protein WD063_18250 [Pirellulales bacterium]